MSKECRFNIIPFLKENISGKKSLDIVKMVKIWESFLNDYSEVRGKYKKLKKAHNELLSKYNKLKHEGVEK